MFIHVSYSVTEPHLTNICYLCVAAVEDRVHVILECSRLDPVRRNQLMEIQSILSRIDAGVSIEIISNLELLMQLSMAVADPGCLDTGFKFTRGFDLLIVPAYMLYFTDFSATSP